MKYLSGTSNGVSGDFTLLSLYCTPSCRTFRVPLVSLTVSYTNNITGLVENLVTFTSAKFKSEITTTKTVLWIDRVGILVVIILCATRIKHK